MPNKQQGGVSLVFSLLGHVLSSQSDFDVSFARNGLEGLDLLNKVKPDVVTLDVYMPQMDGLACLDRIMIEHPCPVVMVSLLTCDGAETTLEALRLGAVDFVAKPAGAVSLKMETFAPEFLAKVRSAVGAKAEGEPSPARATRSRPVEEVSGFLNTRGYRAWGKMLAPSLLCTLAAAVLFQPVLMGPPRKVVPEEGR